MVTYHVAVVLYCALTSGLLLALIAVLLWALTNRRYW